MTIKELKDRIEKVFPEEQAHVLSDIVELINHLVTREDFIELTQIVRDIAIEQRKLVEAQKKTEERVQELYKAQERTEKRLEELYKAQEKTERRLEELTDAQKKTQEALNLLIYEHSKTREQLGGLSHTVGYVLEDRAYRGLPQLLQRDFGIILTEPLKRQSFWYRGDREVEINIIGKGIKENQEIRIIGEAKTQLKMKDIDNFVRKKYIFEELFKEEKLYLLVTYMTSQATKDYADHKGLKIYYSYEFPL